MGFKSFLRSLTVSQSKSSGSLSTYSSLPTTPTPSSAGSQSDEDGLSSFGPDGPEPTQVSASPGLRLPSLSRFLADYTLGFADGLTVPFALTAGLSSLGETNTVIYAGMAEICAGSISMGIGGYLSAKSEHRAVESDGAKVTIGDEEKIQCQELATLSAEEAYLAPLDLPSEVKALVLAHLDRRPDIRDTIHSRLHLEDKEDEYRHSPVFSGLSIALGYLVGGLLPLSPYFIVSQVGDGFRWSFAICVVALFAFGFSKAFVLQVLGKSNSTACTGNRPAGNLRKWKQSLWEGTQMAVLGSMAALAAVLCVRIFAGIVS